jgi:preprotein translocase subunit SecF
MSLALVQFIPDAAGIPFIKGRVAAFILSTVLIIGSIAAYVTQGLNYGIDFTGGISIEIQTDGPSDLALIREIAGGLELGDVQVQNFGAVDEVLIRVQAQEGDGLEAEQAQQAANLRLQEALNEQYPGSIDYRSIEVLGAKVSGELQRAGIIAVAVALFLMLIYIWFRFEWQYSVGAIVALVHDVILTIGMFAVTQLEFNLSTIAAILTIVGYSMNDTVVVYDRIREKIRKFRKMELDDLLNLAINKTLSRTILTSLTTLVALIALYTIGGPALEGFAFAMIWGVVVGTYSSIFVAAPLLMVTNVARESSD